MEGYEDIILCWYEC